MDARRDTRYVSARTDRVGIIMVRGFNGEVQDDFVRGMSKM